MHLVRPIRAVAVAVITVVVLLGGAEAAHAGSGYQGGATITVSNPHPACGSTITVTGSGFTPNAPVLVVSRGVQRVTTDSSGGFSVTLTTPTRPCKGTPVNVVAVQRGKTAKVTYRNGGTTSVAAVPAAATSPLPTRHDDGPATLARLAVLPVALAGYALLTVRRRRLAQARRP